MPWPKPLRNDMTTYTLQREQFIPRPVAEVFAFFSLAENLGVLTPPWMHFRILSPLPINMAAGTLIDYRVWWRWLPVRWRTEITQWQPPYRFSDVQRRGPYKLWHHTHTFQPVDGGTLMTDEVNYALTLGPLGRLMHRLIVKRDVETIFDYRMERIKERFGTKLVGCEEAFVS